MSTTALTASVWGQGRQAIALSAQVAKHVGQGEEECHICRDDIPATISFVPCKHKVCFGCVENMRAKNIFKADKGIKCPFCRQYVDGYKSLLPPNPQVQQFLAEANKAAHIAAQARYVAERKTMQQGLPPQQQAAPPQPAAAPAPAARQAGGSKASVISGEDQTWNCGSCSTTNYLWREFCSKCKKPTHSPYGTDKMSQTRKDIGSMSRSELISLMQEKGAYGLRRALMDMGVIVDASRSYGSAGSVREAVALYGLKRRMLHIAELLADPVALKEVSLHHLSNLAVQRVLEALARLRQAFPPSRPNADLEEFKKKHNGRDPFAVLLAAMHPHVLEYCLHEKGGVYVIQCAATVCNNSELVALGRAICPLALPVCRDPKGVFVLRTLLDLFSQRIWEDEDNREPALKCVDLICQHFMASEQQLLHTAMHALSGKVLVRAVAVSMPRFPALQLAVKVACYASMLATTPGGLATLTELLQLYGHNQQAMEGLRDVVTCICYSLQGSIKTFALQKDEYAQEFLLCLVERLGVEQEVGWLDSIAQELVGVADQLLRHPAGLEVLKFTLTQPALDLDMVALHISDLKTCLGKTALVPVVGDIMERVAQNPPPPAPKYPAASVIQPELRYYLNQGWPTPLPPPPPPKPGDPGYEEYAAAAAARAEAQAKAAAAAREAREAAVKARREAAAARQAEAASSSSSSSAAVLDAWGNLRAASVGNTSSAWEAPAVSDNVSDAVSNNDVTAESSSLWGSGVDDGRAAAATPTSNPWDFASQSPSNNSNSSRTWGDHNGGSQSSRSATPVAAAPSVPAAAPAAVSIPLAIPVAVPIAVPVAIPTSVPPPAPVPAAVPTATPVVPSQSTATAAAATSVISRSLPPPVPRPQQQQPQRQPAFGSVAVADFSTAAPARLNPGISPSDASGLLQQQQQRPQLSVSSRPSSAGAAATQQWPGLQYAQHQQQQQQQQQQRPRPNSAPTPQQQRTAWACNVCTYEHTGPEADFLFCAMCSSQRPADS